MNTRNLPCPCNSGKKHKKCCGSEIELKKKRDAKWEKLCAERAARVEAAKVRREKLNKEMPAYTISYPSSLASLMVLSCLSIGRRF